MNATATPNSTSQHLHIVCPHCHTTNRIAADNLSKHPNCGQCKQALFDGHPHNLDEAAFDKHIAHSHIPVLVDFWAPWCGPCIQMAPAYAQVAKLLEPQIRVVKADTEAAPNLGARYSIRSIPTLMIFVDGKELARRAGAMGANDIALWAQLMLKPKA